MWDVLPHQLTDVVVHVSRFGALQQSQMLTAEHVCWHVTL